MRRSLVELTAAASRVLDQSLLVMPHLTAASAYATPQCEHAAKTADPIATETRATASISAAAPEPSRGECLDSGATAEMLVKIAADYQEVILNNFKSSTNGTLDIAKHFTEKRVPTDGTSNGRGEEGPNNSGTALEGLAADIRAKTFELMKANADAAVACALELAAATTAADFVKLSGTHARTQCQLMLKQARAAGSYRNDRDVRCCRLAAYLLQQVRPICGRSFGSSRSEVAWQHFFRGYDGFRAFCSRCRLGAGGDPSARSRKLTMDLT